LEREKYLLFALTLLISFVLTACSAEKPYEIMKTESKVIEFDDRLQLDFQYEINNYSDEDYYFTLVFPPYIQKALITKVGIVKISADSSTSGGAIVAVSKDGAEMTEETINAIVNGELPFLGQILIGKTISLN